MAAPLEYTADMVRHLNDLRDWRWPRDEVVDGALLVTPAPRRWHQRGVFRLLRELGDYLDREPAGEVLMMPADISWGPKKLVQPDVFVVPFDGAPIDEWTSVRHLLLAIEVVSPGSERGDRIVKRQLYQREGVPLYWMVDIDARAVEVWMPETQAPHIEHELLRWRPVGVSTPFTLALTALFRPL